MTRIRSQHISRGDVTADLSRQTSRCDVTFSRLYTPCYSETKDVITSKIQAMYTKRNIKAGSYNNYGSGKAISIRVPECVCSLSYPACNVHEPYYRLWPARLYSTFPQYYTKGIIIKKLLNPKCVFWLPLQLLFETLLIVRINGRGMIENVRWS
jgi:hypothetical protein